ncbi:right-handed parallel beta-helix repeat-containing protein, partial [Halalkalibacter okhensis]|uniref:right-handed parallel beta-helix repeat-containing protein n=1 Tax=Halalkalibacter okhensis TaxID=333138 RepID=UPI00126A2DFE
VSNQGRGTIEHCEIYEMKNPSVVIKKKGNPMIRECKIYDNENIGLWVKENGQGTIENCEIFKNRSENVLIESEGNPVIRRSKIYESEESGIWVTEKGLGTIEDCEIYSNTKGNVDIDNEGNPTITRSKIYKSAESGIWINNKGLGTIEDCEIYENKEQDLVVSEDSNPTIIEVKRQQEQRQSIETELVGATSSPSSPSLDEVLAELHSLIGMENIKEEIQKTIEFVQFNQDLTEFGIEAAEDIGAAHTVFYGNPGTRKTTVANLLGKLYKAMGLLTEGHVVQVNREKLVGEYIGSTAPKTQKKIDEAIGGVLFIDEAYELTNKGGNNDFGPEALALLLEEMENRKGEFIVVVAGYNQEMHQFLEVNPGLKSRFTQFFELQDYTPDELVRIANKMANDKKRSLSESAVELLHKHFTTLWRKRDRMFSNARLVRNYVEGMLQVQAQRCRQIPKDQWTREFLLTLTEEDVKAVLPKEEEKLFDLPINEELLFEALQKLQRMVGMNEVKREIEKLITLVRFYREEGRNLEELSPHTLLLGSPGTGKTEVARIISKIYEALGILERGDLIEVNRDKLISAYQGESERLVASYIKKAMGGNAFY